VLPAEGVTPHEDERRLAVGAAECRAPGGQLGLGAGRREEPEQLVDEVLVGADDERAGGGETRGGHPGSPPSSGQTVPDRTQNCG